MKALFEEMIKTFGQYVREQREAIGWTVARAADQAGWPWPRWKRIEEDEPKRADGSPPQLRRETVKRIAQVLKWDEKNALLAAGYSPEVHEEPTPYAITELDHQGNVIRETPFTEEDRARLDRIERMLNELLGDRKPSPESQE